MSVKLIDRVKQGLLSEKLVEPEQLRAAESEARDRRESVIRTLVKQGYISEEKLTSFLGSRLQIPYVDLKNYTIDPKVLALIPEKVANKYKILPLFLIEDVLTVATCDPMNVTSIDELSVISRHRIEFVIASEDSLNAALNQWYGVGDSRRQLIDSLARDLKKLDREVGPRDADESAVRSLRLKASEPEVEALADKIIVQAVLENASDVHFEPGKDSLQVRFRIDGVLFKRFDLPASQSQALIARIKLMAGLDIAKRRVPQDGGVGLSVRERSVDIRVSVFPALYGENTVLGISNKSREVPDLTDLGLSEENLGDLRRAIRSKKGLVLFSGPADSHKTTTVYSALKSLRCPEKKIMTIEDPVECELEGVVQGQVDLKAGLTYSEALNAMLHQDPDVIYLGEIKDFDTAGLAIRAALTGHLVLSTVHANNSFEAVTLLYDMGVSPGLLESVLNCSIAQRQVRRICPNCRAEYEPLEKTLSELGLPPETPLFKGEGCQQCSDSGYKGTTGIFEVLVVSKRIRKLIASFTSEEEIMDAAWSHGMKSLYDDGLSKVVTGITTLDELRRVLYHHLPKSSGK